MGRIIGEKFRTSEGVNIAILESSILESNDRLFDALQCSICKRLPLGATILIDGQMYCYGCVPKQYKDDVDTSIDYIMSQF